MKYIVILTEDQLDTLDALISSEKGYLEEQGEDEGEPSITFQTLESVGEALEKAQSTDIEEGGKVVLQNKNGAMPCETCGQSVLIARECKTCYHKRTGFQG